MVLVPDFELGSLYFIRVSIDPRFKFKNQYLTPKPFLCNLRNLGMVLAFAAQVGPFTGLDEVRPVEGVELSVTFKQVELHLPERGAAAHAKS